MKHKVFFLIFFLLLGAGLASRSLLHQDVVRAADAPTVPPVIFHPNITIPNSKIDANNAAGITVDGTTIGVWFSAIYIFFSGVVGILAAVMVMYGGLKWLTAGGNASRVTDAKDTIYSAIIAIILTLGAYVLLYTINPDLVLLKNLDIRVKPITTIEQPGDYGEPPNRTDAVLAEFGSDEQQQVIAAEQQSCPTLPEMKSAQGVPVKLTAYLRPENGDKGSFNSFECNLGFQCSCDRDRTQPKCTDQKGHTFDKYPCSKAWFGQPDKKYSAVTNQKTYCAHVSSDSDFPKGPFLPKDWIGIGYGNKRDAEKQPWTAAVDPNCFPYGTTFAIAWDTNNGRPYAWSQWKAADSGDKKYISGRHIDLFMGEGAAAKSAAHAITGSAKIYVIDYVGKDKSITHVNTCTDTGCKPVQ